MSGVSTVIAALDEELHIGRVVASARALGPVFVIDGGSRDRTRRLAEEAGATVVDHPWEGYAVQKNWALQHLRFGTGWVLSLDADEIVTPVLRAEIREAIESETVAGYWLPRRNVFLGRVLRHAWWYPDYQLRLFRVGQGRFEDRLVHEHVLVEGETGFLREPLVHENLKGIDAFVARQLRYAGLEAEEMLRARGGPVPNQRQGKIFGTWPERRRALKTRVWYRLPGKPLIRFLWMYVLKRGFLDGKEGRVYCELLAFSESLISAKQLEQEAAVAARGARSGGTRPRRRPMSTKSLRPRRSSEL
jgi:glycosyltransferase involved in cell wall biosynthesis